MNALEITENRKKLGLTQAELAEKIGVSLKTISNYENGGKIPKSKKVLLLNVLSNNTLNIIEEPSTIYNKTEIKNIGYKRNLEKIKELKKSIELATSINDTGSVNYYEEMIRILEEQNQFIIIAEKNTKNEKEILKRLDLEEEK